MTPALTRSQLAKEGLPSYFTEKYWVDTNVGPVIKWAELTGENAPRELLMLSTGELSLLGIIADLEDRPGCVRLVREILKRDHGTVTDTFTGWLWNLDLVLRDKAVGVAKDTWLR